MTRSARPSLTWRSTRRAVLAVVVACCALGATAAPAAADNDLESASPRAGAKLRFMPDQVRLTFDDLVFPGDTSIRVTGPDGDATEGGTSVNGREVSRRLADDLPDGRYVVSWRVDGGLFGSGDDEGSYTFVVGTPATPRPAPAEPSAPAPTRTASASATPTPTPTPEVTRTALSPAAVSTLRPSPGPVVSAAPTIAVPRPAVAAIDTRRDEWLPPPVFWWGVIVLTATLIGAAPKLRRWLAAHPPAPRRDDDTDPDPAAMTALVSPERGETPPNPRLTPPIGALRTPAAEDERDEALR